MATRMAKTMLKNKKIVSIIPARGGSKGIPKKNIKLLAGKPLITYSIEASLKSKYIDRTIVSTDDEEISRVSKECGAEVIKRPKELARDGAPTIPVVIHTVNHLEDKEGYKADVIVLLQPTSPLREVSDIDKAIEKFLETDPDIVVSVTELKYNPVFYFKMKRDKLSHFIRSKSKITRRQDSQKVYTLNGAIYVMSRQTLKKDNIYSGDMRAIVMDNEKSIDIDTMGEFKIAEFLINESKARKQKIKS